MQTGSNTTGNDVGDNLDKECPARPVNSLAELRDVLGDTIHSIIDAESGDYLDLSGNDAHGTDATDGQAVLPLIENGAFQFPDVVGPRRPRMLFDTNGAGTAIWVYARVKYDPAADPVPAQMSVFQGDANTFAPIGQIGNSTADTIRLSGVSDANPFSINGDSTLANRDEVYAAMNIGDFVNVSIGEIPNGQNLSMGDHQTNNGFSFHGEAQRFLFLTAEPDECQLKVIDAYLEHGFYDDPTCKFFAPGPLIQYNEPLLVRPDEGALGSHRYFPVNDSVNNLAQGESTTRILTFRGPMGKDFKIEATITNSTATTNHVLSFNDNNPGLMFHGGSGQNGRYRIDLRSLECDVEGNPAEFSIALLPGSMQTSSERFWAAGTATTPINPDLTPVDTFLNPGNVPATFPANGVFGTASTDQAQRFVGYENKTEVTFEWVGSANAGSSIEMFLYEGPDVVELDHCAADEQGFKNDVALGDRINALEGKQTLCINCYDRQGYTVAYDEREAVTAATRALNDVAGALSFYAGPVQVPFEGFLVTLTNTTAGAVSITSFVEDVDSGAQIASSTLSIAPGTAEYFFPFPGLLVGDNNGEGYDLLWSGALADVTMDLAAPRSQAIGEIFSVNADFRPKAAWVTALVDEQVKVLTLTDGTQLAYDANNVEIDISGGLPAGWTPCVETDNDTFFVREECYEFNTPATGPFDQTISFSTLAQPTTATIGVATHATSGGWTIPAIADLVEQMGPSAEWRMTGMVVATAANNQGNGSVVNQTQGISSNSVLINPADTNQFTFPSFQPEATDVWTWGGIVANTRNVDMQEGDPGTDNVGRADGPRLSFQLSYRVGTTERVTVQTYEDQDGNQFFIQTDEAGVRSALASIPAEWTLCPEKEYVCDDCYVEAGAALPVIDNDAFADEITPAQLATLPAGAHMRWTATNAVVLDTLELNGFTNGTATISWLTQGGVTGSGSVTFNATNPYPLALGGVELAAGETIDFTLESLTAGQMQLTTEATSISNGWTALQDYSAFANTSHWATRLLTSEVGQERIVRFYTDGTLATVDKDTNTVTPLASLPDDWTLCPETKICASPVDRIVIDTSASTAGADAGSVAPGTGTINGSTGQVPEPIANIQAWIDANIDYAAPTTVVAGNDLQSPTTTGGQTDANWLEFYVVVDDPANNLLSFTTVSEGYLKVEIGECCGDYVLGNQFHNAPPGNSHTIPNPLPIGVHKIRLTNVDVGGSESIWTFDGTATNWFAASGEKPVANITQLYVDCDGNYFEDAEATVLFVGTSFALGQYACPVNNLATIDDDVEARLTALESGGGQTSEDVALFKATRSGGQSIPSVTDTKLTGWVADQDTAAAFLNDDFVAPVAGEYSIDVAVRLDPQNFAQINSESFINVLVDGVTVLRGGLSMSGGSFLDGDDFLYGNVSGDLTLSQGQVVSIDVRHGLNNAANVNSSEPITYWHMHQIASQTVTVTSTLATLQSPDGTNWAISVDNAGAISTTAV